MSLIVGDYSIVIVVSGPLGKRQASYQLIRLPGRGGGLSVITRSLPETFPSADEAYQVALAISRAQAVQWTRARNLQQADRHGSQRQNASTGLEAARSSCRTSMISCHGEEDLWA